ncbi:HupE/UreJ family protein [Bacillus sp. HMF5848]|uniref:HupE/UreJ family protein n=1 Tax=Bacillus sp. HMF5848 TaxID=2495421 RepID=UPI001639A571|nr:HupE/UreJ family protein [Bacillus sp. HMF5848]
MKKLFAMNTYIALIIILLTTVFTSYSVSAHALSASFGTLEITENEASFTFSIDELSVIESVNLDQNNDGKLSTEEVSSATSAINEWIGRNLTIQVNGMTQRLSITNMMLEPKNDLTVLTSSFTFPVSDASETITIVDNFYKDSKDNTTYTHFLSIKQGDSTNEFLFKGDNRELNVELATAAGEEVQVSGNPWWQFFVLGMEHIITGYDHLLFLFALLLARQTFKQLVMVVTSFTVAHSITLTLGYLNIFVLPGRFVESVIALSICYVAIENIFRKEVKNRWGLTFAFGLIHGLGFAGLLSEMTIPKSHLVASLLSFNLGIEVIQIALVAILIPILTRVQKLAKYTKYVQYGSAAIILIGAYWVVERVFQL